MTKFLLFLKKKNIIIIISLPNFFFPISISFKN